MNNGGLGHAEAQASLLCCRLGDGDRRLQSRRPRPPSACSPAVRAPASRRSSRRRCPRSRSTTRSRTWARRPRGKDRHQVRDRAGGVDLHLASERLQVRAACSLNLCHAIAGATGAGFFADDVSEGDKRVASATVVGKRRVCAHLLLKNSFRICGKLIVNQSRLERGSAHMLRYATLSLLAGAAALVMFGASAEAGKKKAVKHAKRRRRKAVTCVPRALIAGSRRSAASCCVAADTPMPASDSINTYGDTQSRYSSGSTVPHLPVRPAERSAGRSTATSSSIVAFPRAVAIRPSNIDAGLLRRHMQ